MAPQSNYSAMTFLRLLVPKSLERFFYRPFESPSELLGSAEYLQKTPEAQRNAHRKARRLSGYPH